MSPLVDVLAVYARDSERWWLIPVSAFGDAGFASVPSQIDLTEHLSGRRTKLNALSSYLDAWWVFGDSRSA